MDWNSVAVTIGTILGVVALPLVTLWGYLIGPHHQVLKGARYANTQ